MPKLKANKVTQETEQPNETKQEQTTSNNYLTDSNIQEIKELKDNFENEVIENEVIEKKKRGRKPKQLETEIEIPLIDLSPLLDIGIKRMPNPIPLTDIEKTIFNETANKVFKKYSNNFKYIEEINFSLVLISIVYPRLMKDSVINSLENVKE